MMLLDSQKRNLTHLFQRHSLDHLRPPPAVYSIVIEEKDYFSDQGTDRPRRVIYYKVPYQADEADMIEQVRKELSKKHPEHELTDEVILKHVYSGKWELKTILDRLDQVIAFTQNPVVTKLDLNTFHQLKKGFFYSYGFDRELRPVTVLRIDLIDFSQSLDEILNTVYYVMLYVVGLKMTPYHAEKHTMIVDFNHLPFTGIPYFSLYDTIKKIGIYFTGFLTRTICINAEAVAGIWSFISRFITEAQRKKFILVDESPETLFEYIDPGQLQKKYKGNLPNLTHYWPPKNTSEALEEPARSESSDYESVLNDYEFFNRNPSSSAVCQPCSCVIY